MTATDAQVRIALRERQRGKTQQQAAAKANLLSRKTVAKYEKLGRLPSEMKRPRAYRTRPDPFEEDWPLVESKLKEAPTLQAKPLFEWLCEQRPGKYTSKQLRTFQRRVRGWKAHNTEQLLSLPQVRRPGTMMQVDGTWMTALRITVQGQPFRHLLMHTVLPYSNWEHGRIAQSESLVALEVAISGAIEDLGHVPPVVQTDPSSAATHRLKSQSRKETSGDEGPEDSQDATKGRAFNESYVAFLDLLGIQPASTHVSSPDENGDVEASHNALKSALEQRLLLRGSRDFDTVEAVEEFYWVAMRHRNVPRLPLLEEELAVMHPLEKTLPLPVREIRVRVSKAGTVRVLKRTYSLPSGLKGHTVKAIATDWYVEFWHGNRCIRRVARRPGETAPCIDYRDVIWTLLRKPGGFRNYRYLEALFPRRVFAETWEVLKRRLSPRRADLTYLRILHLAATTLEEDVAAALELLLRSAQPFDEQAVEELVKPPRPEVPVIEREAVDLGAYDGLLTVAAAQ